MHRSTARRSSSSVSYHSSIYSPNNPNIRYPTSNNEPLQNLTFTSKFPSIDLASKIDIDAQTLTNIIFITTSNSIHVPFGITSEIILYTLTLVPGIYNFEGLMSSGSSMNNSTKCILRLILNDKSCVVGGCVQEIYNTHYYANNQSFEYQITDGSYDYETGALQFRKWYFPFNYEYFVVGQMIYQSISEQAIDMNDNSMDVEIEDNVDILAFRGEWIREKNGHGRSGNIDVRLTDKSVVLQHAIIEGKYVLYGYLSIALHALKSVYSACFAKLEIELLPGKKIKGRMYEFEEQTLLEIDYDQNGIPYNSVCDQSYDVLNGCWSHFGQIVFYLNDGRECEGFFNGDFFIGQCWEMKVEGNHNCNRSGSGRRKRFGRFVKSVKDNVMKKWKDGQQKKNRGYFEFQIVREIKEKKVEKGKKNKCKIRSNVGETDEAVLYRQTSLDSDDD